MGNARHWGCSAEEAVDALHARRPAWYRWDELGLQYGYQSIGNALRHAENRGIVVRKHERRGRNFWSLRSWGLS